MKASVPTQSSVELNGVNTDIVICVTQMGKIGNLMEARAYKTIENGTVFDIRSILGKKDDDMMNIYARSIIEVLSKFTEKPLLLGIALKEEGKSREMYDLVIEKIMSILHNNING